MNRCLSLGMWEALEKIMKSAFFIFLVLIFSHGCRSHLDKAKDNIIPVGLNTYTITYTGKSYSAVRTIVYKAAHEHCRKQGKYFYFLNEANRSDIRIGFGLNFDQSVELDFKCLAQVEDKDLGQS